MDAADASGVIALQLAEAGLRNPRIVSRGVTTEWTPGLLRTIELHEMAVLEEGAPIAVFFDRGGKVTGWRDEGRRGAPERIDPDPGVLRQVVPRELGLPREIRIGRLASRYHPEVGWIAEMVMFPIGNGPPVHRVWAHPGTGKVIQVGYEQGTGS